MDFGTIIYKKLQLEDELSDVKTLHVDVPQPWLTIRWDKLHDTYQYLALQRPVSVALGSGTPPAPLQKGIFRLLLTTSAHFQDDVIITEMVEWLNQVHPHCVDLTIEREITGRRLVNCIQTAQANNEPFHLWHHAGASELTPEGLCLQLRDTILKPARLGELINSLAPDLRLFVLHTPSASNTLLPALANLSPACLIGLKMSSQSDVLLRGLYKRLFSTDTVTAVFLARLDSYIQTRGDEWAALEILSRTLPFRLVNENWLDTPSKRPQEIQRPRFLFLRANPVNAHHGMLPIDTEIKHIKNALASRRNQFEMRDEGALETQDFSKYLLEMNPHLLHFSGHGTTKGSLVWETGSAEKTFVQVERIAPLLTKFPQLKCVVLNACYSSSLAELLRPHKIVVIGMSNAVTNDSAVHFARGLYQALAHGETLVSAFEFAREEIRLSGAEDEVNLPQVSDYQIAQQIRFFKESEF